MKKIKFYAEKFLLLFLIVAMMISICSIAEIRFSGDNGTMIKTTLIDGSRQRGRKKTFDVIARNKNGQKVESIVTFNGIKLSYNWDDTDKTSYTLNFTHEGRNEIIISAGGATLSYNIIYKKANIGDVIGTATWAVELFTIGSGYLIEPVKVDILEGENTANALIRLLHENGYIGYYGGTADSAFYLAYIANGDKTKKTYEGYVNSRISDAGPSFTASLNLTPKIPNVLYNHLEETMTYLDSDDYSNWVGYIGEFVFTNGSGWMYSVNAIFPNVGFADSYLSDGDVVRVQYTLGYGADIGGTTAMGSNISGAGENYLDEDYYKVANKDLLTSLIAMIRANNLQSKVDIKRSYEAAISILEAVDAGQSEIDRAFKTLTAAVSKYINLPDNDTTSNVISHPPETNFDSSQNNSILPYPETDTENIATPPTSGTTSLNATESNSSSVAAGSVNSETNSMDGTPDTETQSENLADVNPENSSLDINSEEGLFKFSGKQKAKGFFIWYIVISLIIVLFAVFLLRFIMLQKKKNTANYEESTKKNDEN